MTFIGIISAEKTFANIQNILNKNLINDFKLIHITKKSINNIKNIKFEIMIIDLNLNEFISELLIIKKMCDNAKYVAINTDINTDFNIYNFKSNIVTYGLNRKATVTISSISESGILIYLQKNLKGLDGNIKEIGEERVKIGENDRLKIYEILIIYIIVLLKKGQVKKKKLVF